jgi:peptide/nickel transport system permease protein
MMAGEAARHPGRGRLSAVTSNIWFKFAVKRIVGLMFVMLFLIVAVFLSVRLIPGDPADVALGFEATQSEKQALRHELLLDRPLYQQFGIYLGRLARFDFGTSYRTRQPVSDVIKERIGNSAELAGCALAFTLLFGIPLGLVIGALTREGRHRHLDVGYQGVTQFLGTIPEFLKATLLAFFFAVLFRLLPVAGDEGWRSLVLPTASIALGATARLSRFVRVETLNVLAQDYIRTARSARLPTRIIFLRHTLPNVLTSALTISGLIFAGLIGGAVIVENVFARPGLGTAVTEAMQARDYPLIMGLTLMLGSIVVVVNGIVDVLLALIDKRSLAREG